MSRFQCESHIAIRVNSTVAVKALAALMRLGHEEEATRIVKEAQEHSRRLAIECGCQKHRARLVACGDPEP